MTGLPAAPAVAPAPATRLELAVGLRHGVVGPPQAIPVGWGDAEGLHHVGVAAWGDRRAAVGGGTGFTAGAAEEAAVAEALERYAGWATPLPLRPGSSVTGRRLDAAAFTLFDRRQRWRRGFPHGALYARDAPYTDATDLSTGTTTWVPAALVSLDRLLGSVATSSGMAAAPTLTGALLRALQELVERDALATTWLHGLAPRQVCLPAALLRSASKAELAAFDLTPAWSAHRVAAVAGRLDEHGRIRVSLGVACRRRWSEAVAKAFAEWAQGIAFVAHRRAQGAAWPRTAEDIVDFEGHGLWYSEHLREWEALPLWDGPLTEAAVDAPADVGVAEELRELLDALQRAGIDVLARELTPPDVRACGVRVARVVSPQLTPIHARHGWPFLGGSTRRLTWRYPWARASGRFPSPHPHPLG